MCPVKLSYLCAYTRGLGSSSFPILEKWEPTPTSFHLQKQTREQRPASSP